MSKLYYSTVADYQLEDDVLNIYLPITKSTLPLYQALYDIGKPRNEYSDTKQSGWPLVAAEWYFPKGKEVLKKVQDLKIWKDIFNSSPNPLPKLSNTAK